MKILCEKQVNTDTYAGCVDLITGLDDYIPINKNEIAPLNTI